MRWWQPPRDHVFVLTNEAKAAADARIGARRALRERSALVGLIRPCFARTQTWLQAGKYISALVSGLPSRNGWTVSEQAGDRSPARMQRLLNRASWDEAAAMSQVRRYAAAGLDAAARRSRRRRMTVGALDETGQEKQGSSTAGVKRQYMGCAGRVANGINTVHLSYVREKTGHVLAGARQWIPADDIRDPVKSLVMGLPLDLRFCTKGELAIGILTDAYGDGLRFDFVCGDEVYGDCTALREFLEGRGQAYVLRAASNFTFALAAGTTLTCAEAVKKLLGRKRDWEVRSAGQGVEGRAVVCLGLARDRFPAALAAGPPPPEDRRVRVPLLLHSRRPASVQGPADQGSRTSLAGGGELRTGKRLLRPGPVPGPSLYRDPRHIVLVMAAFAVCAVTAAMLRDRTGTQAPPPTGPDAAPPADPGLIPLTVRETRRLLARALARPQPPGHASHWLQWRRRHQARSRWFHKHARLQRELALAS